MIGIDLGGTNIRAALVAPDGRISRSLRIPTRMNLGVESLLERLEKMCRQLSVESQTPCAAIGIGIPGILDASGAVRISPNLPELNGIHLARLLGERLGCPAIAVNDADAIAWGEASYGAGENLPSFIAVTLGTGVGGGLVLNRALWIGAENGASSEIGHLTVEPEGRLCGCGNRGCLETYASATGMVRSVKEALTRGEVSTLRMLAPDELTALAVAAAARSGDLVALAVIELAARKLGQALAAVINLLNPDGVIFCGGVSNSFALMQPYLEQELQARSFVYAWRKTLLLQGTLGDDAGVLGAAELAGRTLAFDGESIPGRVSFNHRFNERPRVMARQRMLTPKELKAKELYRLISYVSPEEILGETNELLVDLLSPTDLALLKQCYAEAVALYRGEWPGYQACNTEYHNLSHVIHTYLALARILHGGALDHQKFVSREIAIVLCVAIFHDSGYLQETGDTGTGAKYTSDHVPRGIRLFRSLAPNWGMTGAELDAADHLFYATDLATAYSDIPFVSERFHLLGQLLDASDLMTQMSDRAYLEKLLFLYHEFREAGIDFYQNETDLLRKTLSFYQMVDQRLAATAPLVDSLLRTHFRYRNGLAINPYQESIRRQRAYLEQVLQIPDAEPLGFLKRSGIVEKIRQRYP